MKLRVVLAVLAMCLTAAGNCHAQAVTKPDAHQFSPAEQEVWAQEETYWRSLKADDRETYLRLWEVETHTSRLTHTWMRTDQGWKIIGGMSAEGNQDATVSQSSPERWRFESDFLLGEAAGF